MANKSLTDLTARTATADSDLLHINSGGTDYKETKINFLKGSFGIEFSNTTNITTQADALPDTGTYYGTLISSGHQTETGTPVSSFWYVRIICLSAYYRVIDIWGVDDPQANHYIKCKKANTWQTSWTLDPTRAEITSLNNSLANSLVKNPSNIASYNEFDALATSGGFYAFRLSASFTIGGVALPNYGRGLIMNYSSSDSSFIYVSPDGFWFGFKNSGTWHVKMASTF